MKENYIEEELTLAELADRFLHLNDFNTEDIYDLEPFGLEIEDENGVFMPIKNFIVKPPVDYYFTDGKINVSGNHRFVENGKEILAKDHPDFVKIDEPMYVVDIEVDSKQHTYAANGRVNHNTTSGGKAIPFHSSVRLRLKSVGQIKAKRDGVEQIVGIKTRATVVKNRLGPPLRTIDYDIYFESGIDDYGGWLNIMKDYKIVTQGGAWYTYVDSVTGETHKFMSKDFESMMLANPELRQHVYDDICNAYVFKYKPGEDGGIDDVEINDEVINEDG